MATPNVNVSLSSTKLFLSKAGATAIAFLGTTYFARTLGAEQMGVFFLFQALLSMLAVFADLGIGTAVEKRVSEREAPERTLTTATVLHAIAIGTLAAGILLTRQTIDAYVGAPVAPLLVLGLFLSQYDALARNVLKGELRVGELASLTLARRLGWVAGGLLLVTLGLGAEALVYASLAGLVLSLGWAGAKIDTGLGRPSARRARSLLSFAKYNFVPTVGLQVHSWMDVVIVGAFLSQAAVGAYEIAWQVAGVTTLLAAAISTSVLPQTSVWNDEQDYQRIGQLISDALTPALLLIVPAVGGAVGFAPRILELVFGAEYAVAWLALIVLVAGKVPEAIQMLVGRCLLGLDRPDLVARATVVTVAANLALNLLLVPTFGLVGAAVATTGSFLLGLAMRIRYLTAFVSVPVPYRELGWCTGASAVMVLVLLSVDRMVVVDTLPRLLAFVAFGAGTYFLILGVSRTMRQRAVNYQRAVRPE